MGKEIVWIDSELVGKVELIQDIVKLRGEELNKFIQQLADDTNALTTDNIDTALLEMKLHAQKVRDTYKKAVGEEIEKTTELWEDCDKKIASSRTKIDEIKDCFNSLNREIEILSNGIARLDLYRLEHAMDILDRFKSYSEEDKKKIEMLLQCK